jgi:hypothetical protein
LENLFFNWAGIPSFFSLDDLSAQKKSRNLANRQITHNAATHPVFRIIPPADVSLLKIFFKYPAHLTLLSDFPVSVV